MLQRLSRSVCRRFDAVGILIMIAALWTLRPGASSVHLLLLDLAVAWPVATLIADVAM